MASLSRYIRRLPLLIFFSLSIAANAQTNDAQEFQVKLLAISVSDINTSIDWYQKLGFKLEDAIQEYPDYNLQIAFLKQGDFYLEILEQGGALKASELLPSEDSYLGGIFKLGFSVQNIQRLYDDLKPQEDIAFLTSIGDLPPSNLPIDWPNQYFLIRDPDGNMIQFFDGGGSNDLTPWLSMIVVKNLGLATAWYETNLGFNYLETFGETGNKRAIMERNGFVLELYEPVDVLTANEQTPEQSPLGFRKLAFTHSDLKQAEQNFQSTSSEIVVSPQKSDLDLADQHMIVKDLEGNWIQLFQVKSE